MEEIVIGFSEPGRRLMNAFVESKTKFTATLVVATLLHTRAPTGKLFGPDSTSLLSRPTTFQVIGVIVSAACALGTITTKNRTRENRNLGREMVIERLAQGIAQRNSARRHPGIDLLNFFGPAALCG